MFRRQQPVGRPASQSACHPYGLPMLLVGHMANRSMHWLCQQLPSQGQQPGHELCTGQSGPLMGRVPTSISITKPAVRLSPPRLKRHPCYNGYQATTIRLQRCCNNASTGTGCELQHKCHDALAFSCLGQCCRCLEQRQAAVLHWHLCKHGSNTPLAS